MRGQARSLGELAARCHARLIGDDELVVDGAKDPAHAGAQHITFCHTKKRFDEVRATRAACLVTDERTAAHVADELPCAVMFAEDAADLWRRVLDELYVDVPAAPGVHATCVISPQARVHPQARLEPYCVVGASVIEAGAVVQSHVVIADDVFIGPGAHIGAHCVILDGVRIGARTILQPGVVVGADGFGYAPDGAHNRKVRQVGGVTIAEDVEVGANSGIDRGQLRDTVVGAGAKLDNLVQVGHGVHIGAHAVVVSGGGLGGDVDVGEGAVLAGQVGVSPYVRIGAQARIGGKSGVTRDVPAGAAKSGYPAVPHRVWLKTSAHLARHDELVQQVRRQAAALARLEARLAALEGSAD